MANKIYGIVYKITNFKNGKIYIGQTTKLLKERLWDHIKFAHRKDRINQKTDLYRDINKYGKSVFKIEKICECNNREQLIELEEFYIKKYKKQMKEQCYNERLGRNLSEETKIKISNANKGKKAWNKGKECPQFKGKNNGMYGQYGKQKTSKVVICKDLRDKEIKRFVSVGAAAKWLRDNGKESASGSLISAVCLGKRKSIYGYKWEYA